jgi:hypothetical protein
MNKQTNKQDLLRTFICNRVEIELGKTVNAFGRLRERLYKHTI